MAGFGSINTWDIPYLPNYEAAAMREAKVKPIRGDANNTKPLGNNRKRKWYNIRREETGSQTPPDIVVHMHSTDIIRYKPDGTVIVNNGGWASQSTHDMFGAVLGLFVRTFAGTARIDCHYVPEGQVEPIMGEFPMPSNTNITLRKVNGHWTTSDVSMPTRYRVNRKATNKVRKQYAPFAKYLESMLKLRTETQTMTDWHGNVTENEIVRATPEEMNKFDLHSFSGGSSMRYHEASAMDNLSGMMLSGDINEYYHAMLALMRRTYGHYYAGRHDLVVSPKDVLATYNKALMFIHKHTVLDKVMTNPGETPKRDPYANWF